MNSTYYFIRTEKITPPYISQPCALCFQATVVARRHPPSHQTWVIFTPPAKGSGTGDRRPQLGPSHPIKLLAGSLIFPYIALAVVFVVVVPTCPSRFFRWVRREATASLPPQISGVHPHPRTTPRHLLRVESWTRRRKSPPEPRSPQFLFFHTNRRGNLPWTRRWCLLRWGGGDTAAPQKAAGEVNPPPRAPHAQT